MPMTITRRHFLGLTSLGIAGTAAALAGGGPAWAQSASEAKASEAALLKARPRKPTQPVKPGLQELGLAKGRDGIFAVPKNYNPNKPVPFMLMLHGALGRTDGLIRFCKEAAGAGIAIVAPDSRGRTWDFAVDGTGTDLPFIDRALDFMFQRVAVDPRHLAIAGFSDGASYGLSIGLPNGDLFSHIVAFSPGFMQPPSRQGKPEIWVSHGTRDEILPVESSRSRIVPQLKQWGYMVTYREFDGPHDVLPELSKEAFRWVKGIKS
jgi:predicted esterase